MLKRFTSLLLVLLPAGLFAQEVEKAGDKPERRNRMSRPSRDFVMLQLTYEGWADKPDSVKTGGIGRGFNAYMCYDFPIKNSNFSFAAGLGIGTSNVYLDNQELVLYAPNDSIARFLPETQSYKKYKLTTAYLEAPFEFRFFGNRMNRNKGFKAAVGFRAGTMIGAHTKGKLDNKVVYKVNTRNHLENWRFSTTARIGWGNFTLLGTYNLNKLFNEGEGPQISPYSIGICLTGL